MFYINPAINTKNKFDLENFLQFTDGWYCPTNSALIDFIKTIKRSGTYIVSEEGRPDLTSYKLFDDVQYWWILMLYNDVISVEDWTNGLSITVPLLSDLETLYFNLNFYSKTRGI